MDVTEERARALAAELESRDDVTRVTVIPREQALAEFQSYSGFGAALDALEENPLPNALVVRPAVDSREQIQRLADELEALQQTDLVQVDTA